MTSQGFSFPPPPPPPPPQQHAQSFQNSSAYPYGQTSYGPRGGRGSGGHYRGRGRGYGNRGGRGAHYGSSDASHAGAYHTNPPSPVDQSYSPVNYGAYAPSFPPASNPSPSAYNAARPPPFQAPQTQPAYTHSQPFPQSSTARLPPYPRRPSYDAGYNSSNQLPAQSPSYSPPTPGFVSSISPSQPTVMGPPLRWGFDERGPGGYTGASRGSNLPYGSRQPNTYNHHSGSSGADKFTRQGQKRPHSSAFGKPAATAPRTPAPPPVPSFGNPLPSKPPPAVDATRKPKKKKRRHNQLGLTPKTEEYESSEEEDDVDEEAKLAPSGDTGLLQFTYKGRTATLQSPADVAVWIEERKKRFPTQQRIQERKKALEEAQRARTEALKEKQKQKEETRRQQQKEARAQQEREKEERKGGGEEATNPVDAAVKARLKAEKLRRKLMKEEKRVAKAEADAERARVKAEALQKAPTAPGDLRTGDDARHAAPEPAPDVEGTATMEGPQGAQGTDPRTNERLPAAIDGLGVPQAEPSNGIPSPSPGPVEGVAVMEVDGAVSVSPSAISDTSDDTSSSGSDLSLSPESDSDSDSAPETASSRRDGPERVAPPPREAKKKLCRHFAQKGRCARGDKCRFSHEMREPRAQPKPGEKKGKEKAGRQGLLQALLAREREDEDRRVMQAIAWLGEHGILDEPTLAPEIGSDGHGPVAPGASAEPPVAEEIFS